MRKKRTDKTRRTFPLLVGFDNVTDLGNVHSCMEEINVLHQLLRFVI